MKESTNPFEFCFDEETNQLCTKNLKTGKVEKLSDEKLGENIHGKWENDEKL